MFWYIKKTKKLASQCIKPILMTTSFSFLLLLFFRIFPLFTNDALEVLPIEFLYPIKHQRGRSWPQVLQHFLIPDFLKSYENVISSHF